MPTIETAGRPRATPTLTFGSAPRYDFASDGPAPIAYRPAAPPGLELFEQLGFGGMGVVYRAYEAAGDRWVAAKFLNPFLGIDGKNRFRVEAKAAAGLDHPNVARVFAVGADGAEPYFTMELLGGTLAGRLKGGPLPAAEAAAVAEAVARGVAAAHAAGLLHRDVKPSNVLFAADGTPKLADFGLAKRTAADDGLTLSAAVVGTPGYMSPEQAAGTAGVGPAADVYGVGATLYEMLAGRPPFRGATPHDTIHQTLSATPAAIPGAPPDLEAVCRKCLEKDPARRYASADALADDLTRFLEGRPVGPRPPTWLARRLRAATSWWKVAAAIVLPLAVSAAVVPMANRHPTRPMNDRLRAGHAVTLVPAAGEPAWVGKPFGLATTGVSPAAGGAFTVDAAEEAVVPLLPDVSREKYRVSFEVKQLQFRGGEGVPQPDAFGVILGHTSYTLREHTVHAGYAFVMNDWLQPRCPQTRVSFLPMALVQTENERTARYMYPTLGDAVYEPSATLPGRWRGVSIDAGPDGFAGRWREPGGGWTPFLTAGRSEIAASVTHAAALASDHNAHGLYLPEWSPRNGIALYVFRSTVAFRNVVVTPLP